MKLDEIKQLNEASLSRTYRMLKEHDGGLMTAFRGKEGCQSDEDRTYAMREKMQRNLSLRSKIMAAGYGLTSVSGQFIENFGTPGQKTPDKENSFLIIDVRDKGTLRKDMVQWGAEFLQDSILFLPKGGESGEMISTNKCPDGYPGFGKIGIVKRYKNPVFGKSGEFMTKIGNRPFIMKEFAYPPSSVFSKGGWSSLSKKHWTEMPEEMLREEES